VLALPAVTLARFGPGTESKRRRQRDKLRGCNLAQRHQGRYALKSVSQLYRRAHALQALGEGTHERDERDSK